MASVACFAGAQYYCIAMTYGRYEGFGREILQLDDESIKLRKLLAVNAALFHQTCSNPKQRSRLDTPQYGDLVYEVTTLYGTDMERIAKGIGIFVAQRHEPTVVDIQNDEPEFVEEAAAYIQYGPEPVDVCRWTNSTIRVIPTSMHFFDLL